MSFRATTLRQQILGLILLGFTAISGMAQTPAAPAVPIIFSRDGAVTSALVKAPSVSGSSSGGSGDTQWLKVEFHYSVVPPQGDYLNEVQFKVWIEGRDPQDPAATNRDGIAIALTGSVTYVNVSKARDAYGVVYLHPSTLGRYGSSRGAEEFERTFNVHVEADVDGKPVAAADKNREKTDDWYMATTAAGPGLRAIPGLVYHQDQCPFITSDPDRYPALKLPDSAAK